MFGIMRVCEGANNDIAACGAMGDGRVQVERIYLNVILLRYEDTFWRMLRHPKVTRLFEDYKSEEIAYYKKTGIYPPMHCVAMRREVYEANRWMAQSLMKAFEEARGYSAIAQMFDGHLRYALPFLHAAVEEHKEVFGDDDPWRYGVEENRHTLETLVSYSHEQGLIPRRYDLAELFAEETWATSRN